MTQKDLDTRSHIVFFTKEELDNGYHYCDDVLRSIQNRFPDHTFIGLPDTISVKELGPSPVRIMIEELQRYLELITEEEKSDE
jgi:hypothetical protein